MQLYLARMARLHIVEQVQTYVLASHVCVVLLEQAAQLLFWDIVEVPQVHIPQVTHLQLAK